MNFSEVFKKQPKENNQKPGKKADDSSVSKNISRRDFIRTATLGAAALAFVPGLVLSQETDKSEKVIKKIIVGSEEERDKIMKKYEEDMVKYKIDKEKYDRDIIDWEKNNKKMEEFNKFCKKFYLKDPLTSENALIKEKINFTHYKNFEAEIHNNLSVIVFSNPSKFLESKLLQEFEKLEMIFPINLDHLDDKQNYTDEYYCTNLIQNSGGNRHGKYIIAQYLKKEFLDGYEALSFDNTYSGEIGMINSNLKFDDIDKGKLEGLKKGQDGFYRTPSIPALGSEDTIFIKYYIVKNNIYKSNEIINKILKNEDIEVYIPLLLINNKGDHNYKLVKSPHKPGEVFTKPTEPPLPPIPDIEFNPLYGCKFKPGGKPYEIPTQAFKHGDISNTGVRTKPHNLDIVMGILKYPNGKEVELTVRKYIELTKNMPEEAKDKVFGPGHKWWDEEIKKIKEN